MGRAPLRVQEIELIQEMEFANAPQDISMGMVFLHIMVIG
jgi:hypothetical protein